MVDVAKRIPSRDGAQRNSPEFDPANNSDEPSRDKGSAMNGLAKAAGPPLTPFPAHAAVDVAKNRRLSRKFRIEQYVTYPRNTP